MYHTISINVDRFRSITKQYFRKADGVVVMYDVTSETSFKSVRNWMSSVQDGVEDGTAVVIVGNKTDMCEGDDKRAVKTKDGQKITMVMIEDTKRLSI